ncbi:MAG: hypothetical protein Kow00106_21510 [Anaerolineae bacterium]
MNAPDPASSDWPPDEAILIVPATRPSPQPPSWWRMGVWASLAASLIALIGGLVMVWIWHERQRDIALDATVYSASLDVHLRYPHTWHLTTTSLALLSAEAVPTVLLSDRAVRGDGPYQPARLVVAWQRMDPVTVFRVPRGCWGHLYAGPESTFRCMERQGWLTPTYRPFGTPYFWGVSLAGTLPPTRASYPMIVLGTGEREWLAAIIVHWDGYRGARALLARLALTAHP